MRVKRKIEDGFEQMAHLICRHHYKTIALVLVVVSMLAINIKDLRIDTSNESFLHADDPTLVKYNQFRDQFGRDEMVVVAIESDDIFSEAFLTRLKSFHEAIEASVPYLDEVTSLVNARFTRGENDELIVEDLMEEWPSDQAALDLLKKRVMHHPLYENLLISEDGQLTTILIQTESKTADSFQLDDLMAGFDEEVDEEIDDQDFDQLLPETQPAVASGVYLSDQENSEVVKAVERVIKTFQSEAFVIHLTGSPVITDLTKRSMMSDMRLFMVLAILTIGLTLFALFRRLTGVFLPLLIVLLSLISTLGIMGLMDVAFKVPSSILPSFILAIGVGASVHLLAIFYRHLHDHGDKVSAIAYALGHSGLAITMTTLTTAAGLFSFANAELAPIAELGQFAATGALLSLFCTVILLPALLSVLPLSEREEEKEEARHHLMDRILTSIARFSTRKPWLIIGVSLLLVVSALLSSLQLTFSHDVLKWLPEERGIAKTTRLVDDRIRGTVSMEIIIDTGRENGLYSSDIMKRLDDFSGKLERTKAGDLFVGKSVSVADMVKEINQALNNNDPQAYAIPDSDRLVGQELFLFENTGSDDLEDFVDNAFRKARLTAKIPWLDAVAYGDFLEETEQQVASAFHDMEEVTITGILPLMSRTIVAAIQSMAQSYLIAGVVITFLMILLINHLRMGVISMLPNVAPIIVTLGLMNWAGLPLDMFTMLIGGIAIGLAVDDTIHFMHNFQRYADDGMDIQSAIDKTLHTTGRAMLVTTVVLSLGFFIFMLASMSNLFLFGLLTGTAIILALLSDFLLAPALVTVFYKRIGVKGEQS